MRRQDGRSSQALESQMPRMHQEMQQLYTLELITPSEISTATETAVE